MQRHHPFKPEGSLSKEESQTGAGSQLTFHISSPGCSASSSLSSNPKAFFKLVLHLLLQPVMQPAASLLASELVSKSCVCYFFPPGSAAKNTTPAHMRRYIHTSDRALQCDNARLSQRQIGQDYRTLWDAKEG